MSETKETSVTLSKEDQEIADQLQDLVLGGDGEDINFEDLNDHVQQAAEIAGGSEKGRKINTNSVGKAITDGNDMRRLLSDLIES